MATGSVKWFNATKGWGFISDDADNADVFVHHSVIQMEGFRVLNPGDRVSFDAVQTDKGRQAKNVVLLQREKAKA